MHKDRRLYKNTIMMYLLNIAKLLFPLLTLPYLTRVLSVDMYGRISFVGVCMSYVSLIIDFGFMLSATKSVIDVRASQYEMNRVVCETTVARMILAIVATMVSVVMCLYMEILAGMYFYVILSVLACILNIFLLDFFFRAIERMEVISIRFFITKLVSVVLTFVLIHSDEDILYMAFLDVLSSFIGMVFSLRAARRFGFFVTWVEAERVWKSIVVSAKYFASDAAARCFNGLNTILIGLLLTPADVAFWSLAYRMLSAIQSLYDPITTSLYPYMIKNRNMYMVKKIMKLYMPIIMMGCLVLFFYAGDIFALVAGEQYRPAAEIMRWLLPVVIASFPAIVLGWPTLGAITKVREVTFTTIVTAMVQTTGLALLFLGNAFSLWAVVIVRDITECMLLFLRGQYVYRFRHCFDGKRE